MKESALYEIDVRAKHIKLHMSVYKDRYVMFPRLAPPGRFTAFLGSKAWGVKSSTDGVTIHFSALTSVQLKKSDSASGHLALSGKIKTVYYEFDETQNDVAEKIFLFPDAAIKRSWASPQSDTQASGAQAGGAGNNFCPYCGAKAGGEDSFCRNCGKKL